MPSGSDRRASNERPETSFAQDDDGGGALPPSPRWSHLERHPLWWLPSPYSPFSLAHSSLPSSACAFGRNTDEISRIQSAIISARVTRPRAPLSSAHSPVSIFFFFLQPILPPTFSSISYLLLLQFLLIYLLLLGGRLFRSHCFASSNQIVAYFDAAEFKRRNIDLDGQKKVGMKNRVMMMGSYGLRLKCAKDGSRPESV